MLIAFSIISCKKEWDKPPLASIPVGTIITIKQLKSMYQTQDLRITNDYSLYATVTADEKNGNFYKNIYIQDATGAIMLRLVNSGGLYRGDSIRVYLKGTILRKYNNMWQIDSVDVDKNIIKQAVGKNVPPIVISDLSQLHDSLQSYLFQLTNIQFMQNELGKTWADAINKTSQNRMLEDCQGHTLIVRTSGYANFAAQPLPENNGSITGILGIYNNDLQFYVRDIAEVKMNNTRCNNTTANCQAVDTLWLDFNSLPDNTDISLTCYTNKATAGTRLWRSKLFGGNTYAQTNSYQSMDANNEVWFITPPIQASSSKKLEFKSAQAYYTHPGLSILLSTNYDGNDPTTATWTDITAACTLAGAANSNYAWVNSGTVNLYGYYPMGYTGNIYIAFRYNGSNTNGQTGTFCLDDIHIFN